MGKRAKTVRRWLDEKYLIPKRVYNAGEERIKMREIKFRARHAELPTGIITDN